MFPSCDLEQSYNLWVGVLYIVNFQQIKFAMNLGSYVYYMIIKEMIMLTNVQIRKNNGI